MIYATDGWILNAFYQVKEASPKRLHIIGFHLYEILEMAN